MNIIITGVSSGIGRSLSYKFLQEGHNVIGIARRAGKIEEIRNEYPDTFNALVFDLNTIELQGEEFKNQINNIFKEIDIVVNNAGYLHANDFNSFDMQEARKIMETNLFAPAKLIQLLDFGFKNGSHVINIGSMGGFQGSSKFRGLSFYSSSKAAIACLTECLAEEYQDKGVRFNCLALGAVDTEMLNEAFPGYKAPVSDAEMAEYIFNFAINAGTVLNGKVIPVSLSTP